VTHLRLVYNRPIDVLIHQLWGLIPSQSDTVYVQYYRLERTDNYSITIPYAHMHMTTRNFVEYRYWWPFALYFEGFVPFHAGSTPMVVMEL